MTIVGKAVTKAGSSLWSLANLITRQSTKWNLIRPVDLGVRVISVGNLQVGGTGKTPLVAKIALEAAARGLHVCILSRGYRGAWEKTGGILWPMDPPASPVNSGDEPALLQQLCPEATIAVGSDRIQQFRLAQLKAEKPFDLVILDDGFQNFKIKKDLEILAVTSLKPGETWYRDFYSQASAADLVVWTKGKVKPLLPGDFKIIKMKYKLPPPAQSGPFLLITGVGSPHEVSTLAKEQGYPIEKEYTYPDHADYNEPQVRSLLERAKSSGMRILLTGKDWVKWKALGVQESEVAVIEPQLEITEGQELWVKKLWEE